MITPEEYALLVEFGDWMASHQEYFEQGLTIEELVEMFREDKDV